MVHWYVMSHLYFVRHGESEMNVRQDLVGGRSNHVDLTEKGVRQAKAFGKWLANSPVQPDAVYFSPANRAIQTMNYALEAAGLDMECVVDLRVQELSQGIKEGTSRPEAYNDEVLAQIARETLDFKFQGGESIADAMKRMLDFTEDISTRHPDQTIFIFGHGFAIRSLAGAIKQLPHREIVSGLKTPNLSISGFEIVPEQKKTVLYIGKRVIDEENIYKENAIINV